MAMHFVLIAIIPKVIKKNEHLQVQNDYSGSRLAQNALVFGSSESVNKNPITATSLAPSVETAIQSEIPSESVVSALSCLAPRHHSESLESFSEQIVEIIRAPQGPSSRKLISQGGTFLNSGANRIRWSTQRLLSRTADLLTHLFTIKNLKPATIADYRMAIPDHLGLFDQEVDKSLDLNRLIASFY